MMRFHHVSAGVEWDNFGWMQFWVIPVETTRSPVYVCRFTHGGRGVYRTRFGVLCRDEWDGRLWDEIPKVSRRLDWAGVTPSEIMPRPGEPVGRYDGRVGVFFHIDPSDRRHREGVIARRNACRRFLKFDPMPKEAGFAVEQMTFIPVRRTITVAERGG